MGDGWRDVFLEGKEVKVRVKIALKTVSIFWEETCS
jgi:hypothetical protein